MTNTTMTATDFYKVGHIFQYPQGTEYVYSNWTARSADKFKGFDDFDNKVVFFGLQAFIKRFLVKEWNDNFFSKPKDEVVGKYQRRMTNSIGPIDVSHFEALHDLGYLPLNIKALPEGSRVNIRVPMFTIVNTHPDFFWLTNYFETAISAEVWQTCTSATIAYEFRRLMNKFAKLTGTPSDFVQWQGHDFSMRGMSSLDSAAKSGAAHLLSFTGTDTISGIDFLEEWYNANSDKELIGGSVPATEHSVMSAGGEVDEFNTFKRLITEVYPSGVVSIVSDTWDFWNVLTNIAPSLKEEILARKPNAFGLAKVVFRPDSGDPVKIIVGDCEAEPGTPEFKGAVQVLWEQFGGTHTSEGFKQVHERVGLIYGDSITPDRAARILKGLADKGFASGNIVFGIGSYTYQFNTRDTFGFAMKATWAVVNGIARELSKDPKTDNGNKKSAKGLLRVEIEMVSKDFFLYDQQSEFEEKDGQLVTVFCDGKLLGKQSLADIRGNLWG
jgi:nicotinamide phosphoribosyltransferase